MGGMGSQGGFGVVGDTQHVTELVWSHSGAATSAMSVGYPLRRATRVLGAILIAMTPASTSSTLQIFVNGVSVGSVVLAAGATKMRAVFDPNDHYDDDVISMQITTVGTGLGDVTVVVDTI